MKKKPTGFVAVCQCGENIGAIDYERTDRREAGKLLGSWINDGCRIEPYFDTSFSVHISSCKCGEKP